jgi:sugar phosphate isomerase/epimerase
LITDALRELAPLAEAHGVTLAIEPMHTGVACEWTFLTGLDDTLALLDAVDSPRVQLALDTYHLGDDDRLIHRIPQFVNRIAIVHLGDRREPPHREQNRVRLGEGQLPLAQLVSALASAGYDKFYDVELMGEDIEATDYHALLEHSQQAYRQLVGA